MGALADAVISLQEALADKDARQCLIHSYFAWQWSIAAYQVMTLFVGLKDQTAGKGVARVAK